jgi:hypothetical protein
LAQLLRQEVAEFVGRQLQGHVHGRVHLHRDQEQRDLGGGGSAVVTSLGLIAVLTERVR